MFRDGVPVAALESGQIIALETPGEPLDSATERLLRVAKLPAGLRPYYAR
jgi:hypothetical protein